jgi:hypothetical protein
MTAARQLDLLDLISHLPCGSVVRVQDPRFRDFGGLGVVLIDRGGNHVNVTPLGGFEDKYMTLPRRALTVVKAADVINMKPF